MQFNGTQAYMSGHKVAVLQKDIPVLQFTYEAGELKPSDAFDPELAQTALAHAAWSSIAYEKSLYRQSPFENRRESGTRLAAGRH
jgi:hypothetical protein